MARRSSGDRKSTRLNSSHDQTSYAVFCLKKKTNRVRLARAALKRSVKAGDVPVEQVVRTCPWEAETMTVSELLRSQSCFFFNDTATTEIYTLSLHDALPI